MNGYVYIVRFITRQCTQDHVYVAQLVRKVSQLPLTKGLFIFDIDEHPLDVLNLAIPGTAVVNRVLA